MAKIKVKLISKPNNMLKTIYTACRTCYNPQTAIEGYETNITEEKMLSLINKVIASGHHSTIEHIQVTFAIEGISRACSHQLVRHRHCSFSQQSQRYVQLKENEEFDYVIPESIARTFDSSPNLATDYQRLMKQIKEFYDKAIKQGIKAEDARYVLPNATCTTLVCSMNLRELIHVAGLRLCTRAQSEIRTLVKLMCEELVKEEPWLKAYLQPKCEQQGYCDEHNTCGRKPTLKEIKEKDV